MTGKCPRSHDPKGPTEWESWKNDTQVGVRQERRSWL
jgi:hypothetical protein